MSQEHIPIISCFSEKQRKYVFPVQNVTSICTLQHRTVNLPQVQILKNDREGIIDDVTTHDTWGAYHLTENFGNSGWKVNGKFTFRKFQPKIEEYVLR